MMGKNRIVSVVMLSVILAVTLLAILHFGQDADAEWGTNVFDEVIEVQRTPDHIDDRAPMNGEPMHLEITTRENQTINAADVRFSWIFQGETSAKGGYQFQRIDQSTMEAEIPGYPGGYEIQYEIIVYDEKNTPLQSPLYSYEVIKNGSWNGNDFQTNIDMEWGPMEPEIGEAVVINITSRDPLVTIERADLFYTVNIPEQDPQDGVIFFERVNATSMTYELTPYPAGSRISFHVEAFDSYFDSIRSEMKNFEYPRQPVIGPVYKGIIFVTLMDEEKGDVVDSEGTVVQFYNDSYLYETSPTNGMVFTNQTVHQGSYKMKVEYQGEEYVFDLDVPRQDGSFTFLFEVNEESFSVEMEEQDRPGYLELIGSVLMLIFLVAGAYGALRVKRERERINRNRKERRKKTRKKETWLDGLLTDEDRKKLYLRTAAFAVLSLAGLFWAPFYPWWMIILLAGFVTALSWKLPYISMLVLSVLVTAAAAYQSNEFGWVFLIFSLIVMIGGFFDWRYAYLTLLTVFLAGYGFGFAVPLIAALTISLFMGSLVLITAGALMLVIAPSGNFDWLGFLASPGYEKSFVTFTRSVDPGWSPVDFVDEIGGMAHVNTEVLSTVLAETMGSVIPFFGLLGWAAAMILGYIILKRVEKESVEIESDPKKWAAWAVPGIVVIIFAVISILWADTGFSVWTAVALAGCIPASMSAFAIRAFGEEALPFEYGMEEIRSSDVGKKVSEMVGFRKASFKDIGGLSDVKKEVKNALMVPLLESEMATKYGVKPSKGMLLFGPPGCGKTLMLRAVASDLNVDMIGIKCSDVMSKWYGESENLIASLFEEARARSPCILFLDEIDAIAKRRDFYSTDDVTPRVLSIMLSEMDGMDEAEGIMIVATTNMPDLVDPALMRPGRFDKVIYVPPPDAESREEILKVHMKGKYISDDIDTSRIARKTRGFSGADLANLVREASSLGLERALETRKPQPIKMEDIEAVLDEIKPSITAKMIKAYDKLRREYERKKKGKRTGDMEFEEEAPKKAPSRKEGDRKSVKSPSSTPPPPPPSPVKKKDKIYELDEVEHELEELGDWEGDV